MDEITNRATREMLMLPTIYVDRKANVKGFSSQWQNAL
jgi:hypothetical protein